MSEEHPEPDPGSETGPDPATDARIRALLAELGSAREGSESHTGSMPPEVAARLDETMAGLVAQRRATVREPAASTVVPLRRRWTTRAAAAAAAVIVVGVGGVAAANLGLLGGGGGSVSSDSSSSGAAGNRAESQDQSATPPSGSASGGAVGAVPSLGSASFDRDVAALVASGAAPAPGPRAEARSQESALPRDP